MNTKNPLSLQIELIRQLQIENGQSPCYATLAAIGCTKKATECSWRHDCFADAEELEENQPIQDGASCLMRSSF